VLERHAGGGELSAQMCNNMLFYDKMTSMMLSKWARGQGVSYRTALNWFHAATLPVSARQLPTGTIVVEPSAEPSGRTVAYCRVSSADQRADVERQAGRVA
jgi:putative resolvase